MPMLILALLLSAGLAHAAPPKADDFAPVFQLAGIRLLCEQTAPLLRRGLSGEQRAEMDKVFAADALCLDLAGRLAGTLDQAQLEKARALLDSPLARRFSAAERAVGEQASALAEYRQRLSERPPLSQRLALVRRLDAAAHTSDLAALLRYEVGKTQALLALRARGETLDERALAEQTQAQAEALRVSSAQAVESFMLYAYRRMPSTELAEYAALYRQPEVARLLEGSLRALPKLFAARRGKLK